ncbi:error-prone DNA polymerase [Lentzea atacamensis]|uniref:Error-prone DNA polymerase n=1 Tax=Lentzea atacamensis TaxID=531938 RepID=A0ABX9DY42_9PSEU|nr:error-prone DNA polymerase [Lentzea atacamensis]
MPYVELHTHSNFSFLDGSSHPEELAEEAARRGLSGIALTDHDGMYGVVRLSTAARDAGVGTAFGAELSLGLTGPQNGVADPEGTHLLAVARGPEGYAALCRVISSANLHEAAEKGRPVYNGDELVDELRGRVLVLTGGCRKSAVRQALASEGGEAARAEAALKELLRLIDRYGRDHVAVELVDHGYPGDSARNDLLTRLAHAAKVPIVATGAVHYATPARGRLAAAMAAVRAHRSLDEMAGWLPPAPAAFIRSGQEMAHRFRRYPGAVANAAALGGECLFDLQVIAPKLPPFPVPDGHTEDSWLRVLTERGAHHRYGTRQDSPTSWAQIDRELEVIAQLGFPGYFLAVHDIVNFCKNNNILCQGRGSAANSAVCYALGITAVDPVRWDLLFERFLHPDRDGPPDIDVDIESDRREEVIQYVYGKHGRRHAAQVCNVITYRPKSAVRDMARALGYSTGQQDAWSKQIDAWTPLDQQRTDQQAIPEPVRELAGEIDGFPRHLGIHSGGMVICDRPVSEVVPIEQARMDNRTVLQWDKDDCATTGLVKFDLLGLGMLSAIHYAVDLVAEYEHQHVDIAHLDLGDQAVYDMLCEADTVGVFQVESRAQMSTLPRLKPRNFWDLAIEVGLIRPGPIQGGSVHPFIQRRNGKPWRHDHPLLARALDRTLGVPLFQEQIMQIAVDVAGFTPGEADELRRAMGSKRSAAKMERLRNRFYSGMATNGITGALADSIFTKVAAFSTYGFPMSHALSFAHLVFVSAYFKRYHPAAFCAALLRAQPMGFYSPQTLVADARRHGVRTRRADVTTSLAHSTLEPDPASTGGFAVRLGLDVVRTITTDTAQRIVDTRTNNGPFADLADLARRAELATDQLEALATAGALTTFGSSRRDTLWSAGAAARDRAHLLPGTSMTSPPPTLPGMSTWELTVADLWATRITPDGHPIELMRAYLRERGVLAAAAIRTIEHGTRVFVGGAVTHRQRPPSAGGITFLNLEDETGMVNVVVRQGVWDQYAIIAKTSSALIVRGIVERSDGAINLVADKLQQLDLKEVDLRSRDYR